MKRNQAASAALLSLCAGVALTQAAEFTWSGSIDADAIRNYGDIRGDETNQDITLGANVAFDELVSVDLGLIATNGAAPDGDGVPEERWSSVHFDGVLLNLQFREDLSLHLGDLVYTSGGFRYFAYHSTCAYASGFVDRSLRGTALRWKGWEAAAGMSDISRHITNAYFSYGLKQGGMTWKPYALLQISADYDTLTRIGGMEFWSEWGAHSLHGNLTFLQEKHGDPTFTVLAEPHVEWRGFVLDATGYYAYLPDRPATLGAPDQWLIYAEPRAQLHSWFALGIAGELHEADLNRNSSLLWKRVLAIGHFPFHEGVEMLTFAGRAWSDYLVYWQLGGEILAEF